MAISRQKGIPDTPGTTPMTTPGATPLTSPRHTPSQTPEKEELPPFPGATNPINQTVILSTITTAYSSNLG